MIILRKEIRGTKGFLASEAFSRGTGNSCEERVEILWFNLKALLKVRGNLPQVSSRTCPMFLEGSYHKTKKRNFAFWRPEDELWFWQPCSSRDGGTTGATVTVAKLVVVAGRWWGLATTAKACAIGLALDRGRLNPLSLCITFFTGKTEILKCLPIQVLQGFTELRWLNEICQAVSTVPWAQWTAAVLDLSISVDSIVESRGKEQWQHWSHYQDQVLAQRKSLNWEQILDQSPYDCKQLLNLSEHVLFLFSIL